MNLPGVAQTRSPRRHRSKGPTGGCSASRISVSDATGEYRKKDTESISCLITAPHRAPNGQPLEAKARPAIRWLFPLPALAFGEQLPTARRVLGWVGALPGNWSATVRNAGFGKRKAGTGYHFNCRQG